MRPGRGIIAVLIVLAALGVSCKARTDAGKGSTTSGGTSDNGTTDNGTTNGGTTSGGTTDNGTTNGGTTNGGTDVSGRWEGRMDIIEIHQVIVPKPPPTLYPGETTKVTTSCSLGGQVTVELTQDGSQT